MIRAIIALAILIALPNISPAQSYWNPGPLDGIPFVQPSTIQHYFRERSDYEFYKCKYYGSGSAHTIIRDKACLGEVLPSTIEQIELNK